MGKARILGYSSVIVGLETSVSRASKAFLADFRLSFRMLKYFYQRLLVYQVVHLLLEALDLGDPGKHQ